MTKRTMAGWPNEMRFPVVAPHSGDCWSDQRMFMRPNVAANRPMSSGNAVPWKAHWRIHVFDEAMRCVRCGVEKSQMERARLPIPTE